MAAIRQATVAELAAQGYAGVSFEGVARRVRTSKPVLYRRYRSRAHMVVDALVATEDFTPPATTSGSLRQDLLSVLQAAVLRFQRLGIDTFRGIIAEADDVLLEEIVELTSRLASGSVRHALAEARARGEIGPAEIPDLVATSAVALLRHELLLNPRGVGPAALLEMVDTVFLPLVRCVSRGR